MKKQAGFVSIIVAAVLMVLLSLITIGFSKIMQREQRQSIDRQLSAQAFYAAETAINDVKTVISSSGFVSAKNSCDVSGWGDGKIDPQEPDVRYTCLLIDPAPTSLEFDNGKISTDKSKIFIMKTGGGNKFQSMKFEWSGVDGKKIDTASSCSLQLPSIFNLVDSVPLLRLDITPLSSLSRSQLVSGTRTVFLYPVDSGCATGINSGVMPTNKADLIAVTCDPDSATFACSFSLTGLNESKYIIRSRTIYHNASMKVTAKNSLGEIANLVEAQTVVDATGRANDVLKRIVVRLSNKIPQSIPEDALQSYTNVCKLYQIIPPSTVISGCN